MTSCFIKLFNLLLLLLLIYYNKTYGNSQGLAVIIENNFSNLSSMGGELRDAGYHEENSIAQPQI